MLLKEKKHFISLKSIANTEQFLTPFCIEQYIAVSWYTRGNIQYVYTLYLCNSSTRTTYYEHVYILLVVHRYTSQYGPELVNWSHSSIVAIQLCNVFIVHIIFLGTDKDGRPVIVFSACRLPPSYTINHQKLLEWGNWCIYFGTFFGYINWMICNYFCG